MVVVLGEAVGFVADVLEEPQGVRVAAEAEGIFAARDKEFFFALGD
jgi:hypothetical protein